MASLNFRMTAACLSTKKLLFPATELNVGELLELYSDMHTNTAWLALDGMPIVMHTDFSLT